jgi:hypothetical protein
MMGRIHGALGVARESAHHGVMLDRPGPSDAVALATGLAATERDHWPHPPPGVSDQGLQQAVAVLCLVGSESETDTLATLVATHGLDGVPPRRLAALARLVQQLYPRSAASAGSGADPELGGVAAPEPAVLAHALIVPVLEANPTLRGRLFRDLDQRRLPRVLALLAAATTETFAEQRPLVHELLQGRTLTVGQMLPALAAVGPTPDGREVLAIVLAHTRIEEPEIEAVAEAFGPEALEAQVEIARRRVALLERARRDPSDARLGHARLLGAVGRRPEALAVVEQVLTTATSARPPWHYRRTQALIQKAQALREELGQQ